MTRSSFPSYAAGRFLAGFACGLMLTRLSEAGQADPSAAPAALGVFAALALAAGFCSDLLRSCGRPAAAAGCVVCAVSLAVGDADPSLCTVLLGAGGALILTGGAVDSVSLGSGAARAGIFAAFGLPGLALGVRLAGTKLPVQYPAMLLIFIACCIGVLGAARAPEKAPDPSDGGRGPLIRSRAAAVPAVLAAAAVYSAALSASLSALPESGFRFAWLVPAAAVCAGRLGGGALCDVVGARRFGAVALLLSVPLFLLGGGSLPLTAAALLFSAPAAPALMRLAADLMPGRPGLACGALCASAAAGYAAVRFIPMPDGMASSLPAAGCAVCAVCLLLFAADRRPAGNAKDRMTIQ